MQGWAGKKALAGHKSGTCQVPRVRLLASPGRAQQSQLTWPPQRTPLRQTRTPTQALGEPFGRPSRDEFVCVKSDEYMSLDDRTRQQRDTPARSRFVFFAFACGDTQVSQKPVDRKVRKPSIHHHTQSHTTGAMMHALARSMFRNLRLSALTALRFGVSHDASLHKLIGHTTLNDALRRQLSRIHHALHAQIHARVLGLGETNHRRVLHAHLPSAYGACCCQRHTSSATENGRATTTHPKAVLRDGGHGRVILDTCCLGFNESHRLRIELLHGAVRKRPCDADTPGRWRQLLAHGRHAMRPLAEELTATPSDTTHSASCLWDVSAEQLLDATQELSLTRGNARLYHNLETLTVHARSASRPQGKSAQCERGARWCASTMSDSVFVVVQLEDTCDDSAPAGVRFSVSLQLDSSLHELLVKVGRNCGMRVAPFRRAPFAAAGLG